jgi:hypothetical protein
MRALGRFFLFAASAALAASTSSCFAVTNLDRFEASATPTGNFENLRLTVRGMTSHVNEMFEYRIVDATNTLQSRGIIVPLGGPDASLFATGAVPKQNGPFNLDFYADHDNSGGYNRDADNQTGDHSWRIPLTPDLLDDTGTYVVVFDHNTSFSVLTSPAPPIEIGMPARIRLANMGGFIGKRVEIRIADASSKRVVAFYRIPSIGGPTVAITIPGMIEGGVTYSVEVYTDDNNAASPGSVKAFRVESRSSAQGLDVDFDPATAPQVSDAAPP